MSAGTGEEMTITTAIAVVAVVIWVLAWMTTGRTAWYHAARAALWMDAATEAAWFAAHLAAAAWVREAKRRGNQYNILTAQGKRRRHEETGKQRVPVQRQAR